MTPNMIFGFVVGFVIGMVFYLGAKTELRGRKEEYEKQRQQMNQQLDADAERIAELEQDLVIKKNVIKMLDDKCKRNDKIAKRLKK